MNIRSGLALPPLTLDIVAEHGTGAQRRACEAMARETIAGSLPFLSPDPGTPLELSVVITNDHNIAELNRDYRGLDRPTNVLSFPAMSPAPDGSARMLGDIVVSLERVEIESREADKKFDDHFRHLVIHGLLHLLGYDHRDDVTAERMETLETDILASFGIPDPYAIALSGAVAASTNSAKT